MRFKEQNFDIPQVALDLGFSDQSWHNDGAAWMIHTGLRLGLWVAEEKPQDREHPDMTRFAVVAIDDEGCALPPPDDAILMETESEQTLREFVCAQLKPEDR